MRFLERGSDPDRGSAAAVELDWRAIGEPLVAEATAQQRLTWAPGPDPAYVALGRGTDVERRSAALVLVADGMTGAREAYQSHMMLAAFARTVPFTREDAHVIADYLLATRSVKGDVMWWLLTEFASVFQRAAARAAADGGLGDLEDPVRQVIALLDRQVKDSRSSKVRAKLVGLLGDDTDELDPSLFGKDETFGKELRAVAPDLDPGLRPLVRHLAGAAGVTPTAAWRTEAKRLVAGDGAAPLLETMLTLAATSESTLEPQSYTFEGRTFTSTGPNLEDADAQLVRGAIWAAALLDEPWVAPKIGVLGVRYGTSGGSSNVARDERVANSAAAALASIGSEAAFAELGRMKAKVTNRNVSKQIVKALDAAAAKVGVSPSELLELSVPRLDVDDNACRVDENGGWTSTLRLLPRGDLERTWTDPDGKHHAKPPAAADASWVKRLKEGDKEVRRELGIERGRVEDLLVETRDWALATWRERYLEHPVTRQFGSLLIWRFRDASGERAGLWLDGGIVAADGGRIDIEEDARVLAWHPIHATDTQIGEWRDLLIARQIRQPFKQAFREVYRLTPAEVQTETYSNRFAGHILVYPQARALMTARRWGSNFLGPFDGGYVGLAKREFPTYRVRAEFYHDAVEPEDPRGYAAVANCSTDQVRFLPIGPGPNAALPLTDVPPVVFSEAMRDVDLIVSVTSVAADQNWQDAGQGRRPQFPAAFEAAFNEELTSTARVRREVLERIVPGLVIADRCGVMDRWLRVRGDVRTYKIHLSSGNILMEPSDTYLCIVPARGGASESVFLPFDDDPRLSLILSKAFMLANDRKIRDQSIIRQIEAR